MPTDSPDDAATPSSPRDDGPARTRVVALLALTGILLVSIPAWAPQPLRYESVDDGWRVVLHELAFTDVQWGVDLLYTTGPLGFLRSSVYHPRTFLWLLGWGLLVAGGLASSFSLMFRDAEARAWWIGIAVVSLFPLLNAHLMEYFLTPLLVVLVFHRVLLADSERPDWRELVVLAGVVTGGWVLFPYLCATALAMGVIAVGDAVRFRRVSLLAVAWLVTSIASWVALGQPLAHLPRFLAWSWEITAGYRDAMGQGAPGWEMLIIATLAALVLGSLAWFLAHLREPAIPPIARVALWAGIALLVYLSFSTAFVRQQWLRFTAPALTVVTVGLCSTAWTHSRRFGRRTGRSRSLALGVLAATVIGNSLFVAPGPGRSGELIRETPERWGRQVRGLVVSWTDHEPYRRRHERLRAAASRRYDIPILDGRVDFYGNRQGVLAAHGLLDRYAPRPVFQSFVAYTPALAEENAAFYRSPEAPEWLVAEPGSISGFPKPLFDSLALLEVAARYRPVEVAPGGLVLERAAERPVERRHLASETFELGEPVDLDRWTAEGPVWATLDFEPTVLGRLVATLYRPPHLDLHLDFVDGDRFSYLYPVTPGLAGFLISPQVANPQQLSRFTARPDSPGDDGDRVTGFVVELGPRDRPFWKTTGHVRLESVRFGARGDD